jgi:hypothetical protein
VGMTGSGKTKLCLTLLEKTTIDGMPAIAIDPKGDIANLLLTFAELRPEDFRPWVNEDDAERAGMTPEAFAEREAARWRQGLSEWGQDGARIARMREAVDLAIYTPGSSAGLPLSVLGSLAAPPAAALDDAEARRDALASTASGLLGLVGVQADPVRSREHILLSTLLDRAWRQGQRLDVAGLVGCIQDPQLERVGALDLEAFYPASARFELAMAFNNLLAAPGFDAWLEGEPLDVARLLHTPQGKPRISIVSIAHLGDAERMFFVTYLLNRVVAWMRAQSGTTSLRAMLYMDEIFGFFPPVANPPSKAPLLTLLKQARAFGLGVVLASQNPVDLDYKGLANAGTWFIGRLQTERDTARLLDGLEGAASSSGAGGRFDRRAMEALLGGLRNRAFLMNDVHRDEPEVFQTRWTLSYLRGPLSRGQIKTLMAPRKAAGLSSSDAPPSPAMQATGEAGARDTSPGPGDWAAQPAAGQGIGPAPIAPAPAALITERTARPLVPPEVSQFFLPVPPQAAGGGLIYRPMLLGAAQVCYSAKKLGVDLVRDIVVVTPIADGPIAVDWSAATELRLAPDALGSVPAAGAEFDDLPKAAARAKSYETWRRELVTWLARVCELRLLRSSTLCEVSRPGESEAELRLRLGQLARERRDAELEKLRRKYAPKFATLDERLRRAMAAVEREEAQVSDAKLQSAISIGATVFGSLFGRSRGAGAVGRAASSARSVSRVSRKKGDVARAEQTVAALQARRQELAAEANAEARAYEARLDPQADVLEPLTVKPARKDVLVRLCTLVWAHGPRA